MKKTSISIKEEDLAFCREANLMPSRLLRKKIQEIRERKGEGIDFRFANNLLQRKIKKMAILLDEKCKEIENLKGGLKNVE